MSSAKPEDNGKLIRLTKIVTNVQMLQLKSFQLEISGQMFTCDGIHRVWCLQGTTHMIGTAVWHVQKLCYVLHSSSVGHLIPFGAHLINSLCRRWVSIVIYVEFFNSLPFLVSGWTLITTYSHWEHSCKAIWLYCLNGTILILIG